MSRAVMLWYLDKGGVKNVEQEQEQLGCTAADLKSDTERFLEAHLLLSFTVM